MEHLQATASKSTLAFENFRLIGLSHILVNICVVSNFPFLSPKDAFCLHYLDLHRAQKA